jgi:isopentenyl diphosphate isomerase/L-lactate dehydrogenase-like FMN-dependent dehydrogenase
MSIPQYGDYQFEIYFDGLEGQLPKYPVDFASLERKAAEVLPSWVHSYVAGGCGDEGTQRANVDAFSRYGIVPRMLVGATERDLSVSLFDMTLPTPVFMAPIGVIGLCSQDFHGDIAVAKASAQTGVPMSAGTLSQDRMEDVIPHAGPTDSSSTPGDPWMSSGHCTPGSPKIWARPGCVATIFSSTSSKCPKRTGRSGDVSSAIRPPRLLARSDRSRR